HLCPSDQKPVAPAPPPTNDGHDPQLSRTVYATVTACPGVTRSTVKSSEVELAGSVMVWPLAMVWPFAVTFALVSVPNVSVSRKLFWRVLRGDVGRWT